MALAEIGEERWRDIKLCTMQFYLASQGGAPTSSSTVEIRNPFPFPRPAVTCTTTPSPLFEQTVCR